MYEYKLPVPQPPPQQQPLSTAGCNRRRAPSAPISVSSASSQETSISPATSPEPQRRPTSPEPKRGRCASQSTHRASESSRSQSIRRPGARDDDFDLLHYYRRRLVRPEEVRELRRFVQKAAGLTLARKQWMQLVAHKFYICNKLWSYVDALPQPKEMVRGIEHYNDVSEPLFQEPVKAIASRKMYWFTRLEAIMDAAAPGAPKPEELKFNQGYPHLEYTDGETVLDNSAKQWYMENMRVDTVMTWYTKQILDWHAGEARILGDTAWSKFPTLDSNFTVFHSRFWHYQFMKDRVTREWLLSRLRSPWKERELLPEEVAWILSKEKNETTYIKFKSASGESPRDIHDLSSGIFYFKRGHFVTLAEMFYFGCRIATCADIYDTYMHLPIFLYEQ